MRFRAKLLDIGCIHQLTKILVMISKTWKSCVLRLSEQQLAFIVLDQISSGGTSMFCEINQDGFFDEYRIAGKDDNNMIFMEVKPDNLVRCMKSAQNAQAVMLKLTKKQTPCLTFEITLPSLTMHTRSIVHDVPVKIISSRFWDEHQRPQPPNYDVSLAIPSFQTFKTVIEGMKVMSGTVILAATTDKKFSVKVQTEHVTATTRFPSTRNHSEDCIASQSQISQSSGNADVVEARVDLPRLALFLTAQQQIPDTILCNILQGQAVHLCLESTDVSILFCLPVLDT